MCRGCFELGLRPQFEAALATITEWPVHYGAGVEIHPREFPTMFDEDFINQYIAREVDYNALQNPTVPCPHILPHGNGDRCGNSVNYDPNVLGSIQKCARCEGSTCMRCRTAIVSNEDSHVCERTADNQADNDPDLGQRGKDFQSCPRCDAKIVLGEACNHITCRLCSCAFCYICGDECGHSSSHWASNGKGCPRFGQPSDESAQFDGTIEEQVAEFIDEYREFEDWFNESTAGVNEAQGLMNRLFDEVTEHNSAMNILHLHGDPPEEEMAYRKKSLELAQKEIKKVREFLTRARVLLSRGQSAFQRGRDNFRNDLVLMEMLAARVADEEAMYNDEKEALESLIETVGGTAQEVQAELDAIKANLQADRTASEPADSQADSDSHRKGIEKAEAEVKELEARLQKVRDKLAATKLELEAVEEEWESYASLKKFVEAWTNARDRQGDDADGEEPVQHERVRRHIQDQSDLEPEDV